MLVDLLSDTAFGMSVFFPNLIFNLLTEYLSGHITSIKSDRLRDKADGILLTPKRLQRFMAKMDKARQI